MKARMLIGTSILAALLVAPAASLAQLPGGLQIPGLSKDALLQQAKDLTAELLSMKTSGKLPEAQTKQVNDLLPKAQSLTSELEKPQIDTSRLTQLAANVSDLQKQVGALKGFVK